MKKLLAALFTAMPFLMLSQELASPNGQFSMQFELNNGAPTYQLALNGKEIIKPSTMGFELKDMDNLWMALQ